VKRRIYATFDNSLSSDFGHGNILDALESSRRFLRKLSDTVGFNQVSVASITSADMAEVSLYEATNEPGIKAVRSFYPAKSFRIYISQFMAGETLGQYYNRKLSDSAKLELYSDVKVQMDETKSDEPNAPISTNSVNVYSYGARIRQMEEDMTFALALKESEDDYRDLNGFDALIEQQAKSDGLVIRYDGDKRQMFKTNLQSKELPNNVDFANKLVWRQARIRREIRQATGFDDESSDEDIQRFEEVRNDPKAVDTSIKLNTNHSRHSTSLFRRK
jgi:hypothetical protein